MQLNWLYTTLLSIILFAVQATPQYTTSSVYAPPPTSTPYAPPPSTPYPPDYTPTCTPSTLTVTLTSVSSTTVTTTKTSVTTETVTTQAPYGYDKSYITPMKKKTGLIIGLVVGLCGLALLLLIALLLFRRTKKTKDVDYGKGSYGENTTKPTTSY